MLIAPETIPAWIERLRARLTAARTLSRGTDDEARYVVRPPLPRADLEAFEAKHGLRLPAPYRAFLLEIGDGGAGPDYGLEPLAHVSMPKELPVIVTTITSKAGDVAASVSSGERPAVGVVPDLARPFLLKERWSVRDAAGAPQPLPIPEGTSPYDGSLYLTDLGCGYFSFLVVHGEGAGGVWEDYTAADAMGPTGLDFAAWYDRWLDASLHQILLARVQRALKAGASLSAEEHALLVENEAVFVAPASNDRAGEATVALYLGQRAHAEACLDVAEREQPGRRDLPQLRRWLYAADFAEAEGSDLEAQLRQVGHRAGDVRVALARNERAADAVLAQLVDDPRDEVRGAVASNPAASSQTLQRLADALLAAWRAQGVTHARFFALEAVLRSARTPPSVLAAFARLDADDREPLAVALVRATAHNPALPEACFAPLATHAEPCVRHAIALNPRTPESLVDALAEDPDATVRAAVASRDDASVACLAALAADRSIVVRKAAIWNPRTPGDAIARLVCVGTRDYVLALAHAKQLPEAARALLALHPFHREGPLLDLFARWPLGSRQRQGVYLRLDASAAEAMAGFYSHPSFPPPLMPGFVEEQYRLGGLEMASHPWLPAEFLDALSRDAYGYTRARVAENARVTPAILARLATDELPMVRNAVTAATALVTEAILAERAGAADRWVRRDVLLHEATPAWLVEKVAGDADHEVRKWASLHPRVPASVVDRLAADPHPEVRAWAEWRRRANALSASLES